MCVYGVGGCVCDGVGYADGTHASGVFVVRHTHLRQPCLLTVLYHLCKLHGPPRNEVGMEADYHGIQHQCTGMEWNYLTQELWRNGLLFGVE